MVRSLYLPLALTLLSSSVFAAEAVPQEIQGSITAPSRNVIRDGYNMVLQADLLYWIAQEDGLDYAQSGFGAATDFNGSLRKLQPHWDPGVKVTFGGNMPYDGWDFLMSWTYYSTHARQGSVIAFTTWAFPDNLSSATVISTAANWRLKMNLFDVEMGRGSWVGEHLSLRPFLGVRGAWFNQYFATKPLYLDSSTGYTKARSNLEAGGLRAGLEMLYEVYHGWGFYGLGSGSLLYSHFDCPFYEKHSGSIIAKSDDNFHAAIANAQLAAGLQWGTHFASGRFYFTGRIGWEQNIWFGVNRMQHWKGNLNKAILDETGRSLSLQGGSLSARLDF